MAMYPFVIDNPIVIDKQQSTVASWQLLHFLSMALHTVARPQPPPEYTCASLNDFSTLTSSIAINDSHKPHCPDVP